MCIVVNHLNRDLGDKLRNGWWIDNVQHYSHTSETKNCETVLKVFKQNKKIRKLEIKGYL